MNYLDNEKISVNQGFRIGILENITIGMIAIPYVTINYAGASHVFGLITGLLFTISYGIIMFIYSLLFEEGLIAELNKNLGWLGKVFDIVYALRFIIRASIILLFFGKIIQTYMLRSFNMWWLIVPFVLICSYGASRTIEKRARLVELLFWWMIIPIILVGIFSVTSIEWGELGNTLAGVGINKDAQGFTGIVWSGYLVLLVMSTLELTQFNFSVQTSNTWMNFWKVIVWLLISIVAAYMFIVGILGGEWAADNSLSALNVMEASSFPGNAIERLDYPVLAFWIIGIFAIVSGYMFYSKEFLMAAFCRRQSKGCFWVMIAIIAVLLAEVWGWSIDKCSEWMSGYLIYVDIAISIVAPLIVLLGGFIKNKTERK